MHQQNVMSVDVEDYFQVSAFNDRVSLSNWNDYESRVEYNTYRLLKVFVEAGVSATFFILGWVADRYPKLVKAIASEGHEIASHGYWHRLIYNQSPEEFAWDLQKSIDAIVNACGKEPKAYRAPSFSIVERSYWALEILVENKIEVDSSIFPVGFHDNYGVANAKPEIHRLRTSSGEIVEFPPSAWQVGKLSIPVGGGYFRMLPYYFTLKAIKEINRKGSTGNVLSPSMGDRPSTAENSQYEIQEQT